MQFYEKVSKLIQDIKAPKGQFNAFGKYKYRSCEDILEAVKPHLNGLILTISDDIHFVEGRFYVKAIAKLTDGENSVETTAFARESLSKKGMDEAQVTGSASSYARKYALNGLLSIDDSKDPDSRDNSKQQKRDYKKEKELRDKIVNLCSQKCEGMTPPEKMQWFKQQTNLDHAAMLNQCDETRLNEILNKLQN
jgi:hypothetical protein